MFNIENFMPHGHCYLWRPDLLWSMVIGNAVIALSYFSIPLSLMIMMRHRRNDRLKGIMLMFSAFIFACGATHVIDILVIWYPDYWLEASMKLVTASVSAVTAVALWPIVRRARAYVTNQQVTNEYLRGSNLQLQESVNSLQQQHSDYAALNRMSGYLQVCNNMDEISKTIVDALSALWRESCGALYLLDSNEREFRLAASWGEMDPSVILEARRCWAYRLARPFPEDGDQTSHVCEQNQCGVARQKLCLPIIAGGKTLGLVQLEAIPWPLDDRTEMILPLLLERAGFAIYSMRLQESLEFKSTRDSLTELFNRRYLDETLRVEVDRAARSGAPLSVVMFDLDRFKVLNDDHGHETGDRALQLFARLIRDNLRSGDTACRYGGEEFVLILPDTGLERAVEIAERIRACVETTALEPVDGEKSDLSLTTSAGVALLGGLTADAESLLKQADRALYRAKESGRNQVNIAA